MLLSVPGVWKKPAGAAWAPGHWLAKLRGGSRVGGPGALFPLTPCSEAGGCGWCGWGCAAVMLRGGQAPEKLPPPSERRGRERGGSRPPPPHSFVGQKLSIAPSAVSREWLPCTLALAHRRACSARPTPPPSWILGDASSSQAGNQGPWTLTFLP